MTASPYTNPFQIHDPDGDTGCEAQTLDDARRACEQLHSEGYELPLVIRSGDKIVRTMTDVDHGGRGIWQYVTLASY